nr:hypothetical protein [uncultured Sphaerochaeta sp.]
MKKTKNQLSGHSTLQETKNQLSGHSTLQETNMLKAMLFLGKGVVPMLPLPYLGEGDNE